MHSEFVFIAEAGVLEEQSLLLAESIRENGGTYSTHGIKILQPRPERRISDAGRARFAALGAEIIELAIVSPCPEYGSSFKVLATAEYERVSQADVLIFMDSDIVLLAEPDLELGEHDVAVRPVDVKGMCTAGPDDAFEAYWRDLCRVCAVDYNAIGEVTSTVDHARVKASYNGGLIVAKRRSGLFQKTAEFFLKSLKAHLVPWPRRSEPFIAGHGMVSVEGGKLWGSSQAALSLAMTDLGLSIRILPSSQNFPLHCYDHLTAEIEAGAFPVLTLVHYHHLFSKHPAANPILAGKAGFPPGSARWLRNKMNAGKRLVLVLGMHRSGTSTLTRSLQTFGVNLGSNFNPITPDNPKGFWEDRDFHALNEEMLAHLQRSWDDLHLTESASLLPALEAYLPRGLAVLDGFLHGKSLAGIKDPRFSILLPFWKKVFAEAGIQTSYVIGFRNPLSVAASLSSRDGFPKAKGLWLWVLHHLSITAGTADSSRLIVDYDEMMDEPVKQLERIARFLGLAPDAGSLESFCSEFLDPGLRHARYSLADLRRDPDCDPIVLEMYELFCDQHPGKSWEQAAARWEESLLPFKSLFHLSAVLWQEQLVLRNQAALRDFVPPKTPKTSSKNRESQTDFSRRVTTPFRHLTGKIRKLFVS